jgi:hypothetical protein
MGGAPRKKPMRPPPRGEVPGNASLSRRTALATDGMKIISRRSGYSPSY